MFGYTGYKKTGFTLGEVLITLAIVGIIAAMTVPTLITNYQKHVLETQLEKVYSVTVNACERMLTEENAATISETELFSNLYNNSNTSVLNPIVKKYFKIRKNGGNGVEGIHIYLQDNSELEIDNGNISGSITKKTFDFWVDVNGGTKPNKAGIDIFKYKLDENCSYASAGTSDDAAKAFNNVMKNNFKFKNDNVNDTD